MTALAAGSSTISAGNATAEVTVYAGSELPTGTVVWSAPGNSSGVSDLLMAVPNYDAVADVFAEQHDGRVQAITGDGLVAWTSAPLPPTGWGSYTFLPDFQGGLVAFNRLAIYRLAPLTGQLSIGYIPTKHETLSWGLEAPAIHPDGTVVTVDYGCHEFCGASQDPDPTEGAWVVGINPDATEKFRVPFANSTDTSTVNDATFCQDSAPGTSTYEWHSWPLSQLRIAGDGFLYTSYITSDVNGVTQRSSVQPYSDDQYDLWDQLLAATSTSDFAAAIVALDALAPSIGTSATPVVSTLRTLLQNGNRDGAISYENQMAPWFIRPCDHSWMQVRKLHLLRVAMDGTATDVVVQQWNDSFSTVFSLTPGWAPGQVLPLGETAYRVTDTHVGPDDVDVDAHVITNMDQGALFSWKVSFSCAVSGTYGPRTFIQADACPATEERLTTLNGGAVVSDVVWHPGTGFFETIEPTLQLEDGAFVANREDGLLVFEAAGNVRWTLPGFSSVMTTPGGVVAADSIFDLNGNALGVVGPAPRYDWNKDAYEQNGGAIAKRVLRNIPFGTGWASMQGGNPSATGTFIGTVNAGQVLPAYGLPVRGGSCVLATNPTFNDKTILGTSDRQFYESQRQQLLGSGMVTSSQCQTFFNGISLSSYFTQLTWAVQNQAPYDGPGTTLSRFDAGVMGTSSLTPSGIRVLKQEAVCAIFIPRVVGPNSVELTTAASQGVLASFGGTPVEDAYINSDSRVLPLFTPGTLLHEALHNLTGLNDTELALAVGPPAPGTGNPITRKLVQAGCAPR